MSISCFVSYDHVGTLPHFYGTCSPPKITDVMTTKKGFKYNHLTKPILHAQMPGRVTGVPYCHPTTLYLLRKTLLSTRSTFRRLSIIAIKEEKTANYLFPSKWFVLLFDAQDMHTDNQRRVKWFTRGHDLRPLATPRSQMG